MDKKEFAARLAQLRISKNVSARDMSLSIGQSQNCITSIESGRNLPSMMLFFYICDYLGITPAQFFETEYKEPSKSAELAEESKGLDSDEIDHIIAIMKSMKKN